MSLMPSSTRARLVAIAGGFLAVSYGIGAPLTAFLEFQQQTFSTRFELPPELVYLTAAVQVSAAIGILLRRSALWAAAALTVTTVGAIGAHVRIGSPLTAIPALAYTVVQVWFALQRRARRRRQ